MFGSQQSADDVTGCDITTSNQTVTDVDYRLLIDEVSVVSI